MQTKSSLVRSNGIVELYAETSVDLHLSLIIHPWHAEHELTVGFRDSLQNGIFLIKLLICLHNRSK